MRIKFFAGLVSTALFVNTLLVQVMGNPSAVIYRKENTVRSMNISEDQARSIARTDAAKAYGSLDRFNIFAFETKWTWRVIFELKDDRLNGGGPEYIIDRRTGEILSKTYYQ